MKPYFEYKGKTYEFEANFTIQKQFDKDRQKILKAQSVDFKEIIDEEMLNKLIAERNKLQSEHKNLSKEELELKAQEIIYSSPKLIGVLATMENDENSNRELYERYCRTMFERKYPNEVNVFDEFIDELCCDKGINYVYNFFESVCKKVFTMVGKEDPQQKPSFEWEKELAN